MNVFSGTHEHTLDRKGRVIVPAAFRDELADGLVLAPGQEHCVELYPRAIFTRRVEELRDQPREDARVRAFVRFLLSQSEQATLDAQGRITIPPRLRDYGDLERDLAIIGSDQRIEIWDRSAWREYMDRIEPGFASLDSPFEL